MRHLVTGLFFLLAFLTTALRAHASSDSFSKFDQSFSPLTFDTLHIYPTKYLEFIPPVGPRFFQMGKSLLTTEEVKNFGLDSLTHAELISPIGSFLMRPESTYKAYILGVTRKELYDCSVDIVIFDISTEMAIFHFRLASYKSIEGTMEELTNSWIYDIDKDDDFDLAYIIDIKDYELPNEYSDNISGTHSGELRFNQGEFESYYLSTGASKVFRLIR